MRPSGFSFPCPCPARSKDESFKRFIETTKKKPDKIYNPYPQLAGSVTFYQARSQPLCNLRYLPTTGDPYEFRRCLEEDVTYYHEKLHLLSSFAPANVIARLLLGRVFDSLSVLLHRDTWHYEMEKSWAEIVKINSQLLAICRSIITPSGK